jgi:hypothetical protein
MKQFLMIVLAVLMTGTVGAQDNKINGLPIKLGDSIEKVKAALGTAIEPEESKSAVQSNTKALRLKTRGIWVFFDQEGRTYDIRLDAPFAGDVAGVQIGQSRSLLVEKLGNPAKILKGMAIDSNQADPYLYHIDDLTTVRFDFDQDDAIATIYILK